MFSKPSQTVYTVSRLNREIRTVLEQGFASLILTGEISNFITPASGHWYFSLKDEKAQIKAAMWRGNNRSQSYRPENGAQVTVRARVSLYEPRGDYQLIVEHMEPAGEGQLKQEFDALKMRLAAEGLFSSAYKKPLPQNINRVGVITSATGAAIKDILTVLKRRAPQLEVIIYPAMVQGKEAHVHLINQIQLANARNEVDVLIVGRGGGSLEDLWCFNHEQLARAIYQSELPIVSAVGHEIDTTISDYVADVRAATPSAAAELVSPNTQELHSKVIELINRLNNAFKHDMADKRALATQLQHRLNLCHPRNQLNQKAQRLDELTIALQQGMRNRLYQQERTLNNLTPRLMRQSPDKKLSQASHQLMQIQTRLEQAMQHKLQHAQNSLALQASRLDSVSPLNVLARGYSITKTQQGKVVKSVDHIKTGDVLITELADGAIKSTVL
ncbi:MULTISPECIES: exodeoxyribonuclease VII large subunit [Pseudoalteromonas]|uniref:Exodeoxyribonuclease 7 large subunit n=1 Tax=Pseudoalteromonas agarivorans TaxID=176102 RepID=A0ABR5VV50_9GAMM|nr:MULTISPECIES: exodeoxyribonuclease VII large subunit [Pseudoalteromonas]MDC9521088.1 exodeoxyribonuclease VII large subunit [Pseudoalteromonas sp. Angola-31]MDY6887151.1 exodeoxyribonuclease VII large subunit [Pseudomonadota bacterium]KYL34483.1 exodeoxyribonuclease VII large subunit [Pseudoalteromonas telluritireducens]MCK8131303.1 exodeoxyribonuclease VII large subunit [Pseudoalteromonas sp. 2CM28B]MCQ8820717.1 exodeoxyribonuclease VII large subunit [Pseudoalteromonas agarivorans]